MKYPTALYITINKRVIGGGEMTDTRQKCRKLESTVTFLDFVNRNVMHVAKWDILLMTKYFQPKVKRALNVVIKDTRQLVVGMRQRAKRVVKRVVE